MIKTGDFIKIDYTAYDDKGNAFDSTSGEIAKKMHGKEGAMLIIFGKDRLVSGLEETIGKMAKGEKAEITLSPEKAFGHRNKDMIRIMSEKEFYKSEIMPHVGLAVNLDTEQGSFMGVIKSVSGGRLLVDFN